MGIRNGMIRVIDELFDLYVGMNGVDEYADFEGD